MMKKLKLAFAIAMTLSITTACNTFRGMGRDIERGGEKVQDAASGRSSGGSSPSRGNTGTGGDVSGS